MLTTRFVQLALSGVLVFGSFAFAKESDETGRPPQGQAADAQNTRQSNPDEATEKPPVLPPSTPPSSPK